MFCDMGILAKIYKAVGANLFQANSGGGFWTAKATPESFIGVANVLFSKQDPSVDTSTWEPEILFKLIEDAIEITSPAEAKQALQLERERMAADSQANPTQPAQ